MSCRRYGYPSPFGYTSPYRSSPLVGFQGHIAYPHIAAECMFELVVLLLTGHMWGSIGVLLLFAGVISNFPKTWLLFVTLVSAVIGRDLIFLLRFSFHSHIKFFSCEISIVCYLKFPDGCFFPISYIYCLLFLYLEFGGGRGVMFKALDCGIVVSEFDIHLRYYVQFRTNTPGKVMTLLSSEIWVKKYRYCSSRGMDSALNNPKKVYMPLNKESKPISNSVATPEVFCCN